MESEGEGNAPRGFLYVAGAVMLLVGLLIASVFIFRLQPAYAPPGTVNTSSLGGVTVTMPSGVGSDLTLNYDPHTLTVVIGVNNTVTWVNADSSIHTVTAADKSFDSGNIAHGASFTFTFTKAGTYDYSCIYHSWMKGTVVVKPAG